MAEYESSRYVDASAQELFEFLAEVGNLPRYFPRMTSATSVKGEAVHVTANLGDRRVEGEAWFRAEPGKRTISWGPEGANAYHGHLSVEENDVAEGSVPTSTVRVMLTTARATGPEIEDGVDETLGNIAELMDRST